MIRLSNQIQRGRLGHEGCTRSYRHCSLREKLCETPDFGLDWVESPNHSQVDPKRDTATPIALQRERVDG
jgi:hypothetical protein